MVINLIYIYKIFWVVESCRIQLFFLSGLYLLLLLLLLKYKQNNNKKNELFIVCVFSSMFTKFIYLFGN
jgi:hypothetical protein